MAKRKKAGRPRLSETGKGASKTLGLRPGNELLARIDSWRKGQTDRPSQSDAVRKLLDEALKAAGY